MAEHFDSDPELEAALRARSGGEVAVADAFDAVLSRSAAVRRRRMATTTLAVSVLAIGGFALLPRGGERTIAPADEVPAVEEPDPSTPSGERDDSAATTTIAVVEDALPITPPAPTDDAVTSSPADDSDDSDEDDVPAGGEPVTAPASTVTSATTAGDPPASPTTIAADPGATTTTPATTTTTTASTSTTSPTATPIAPFTRTYQSVGGSITVSWNGSALSLQAVTPASGFDAEIENEEPMRIRVRFRGPDDDARIQVRIDGGQLLEEIS